MALHASIPRFLVPRLARLSQYSSRAPTALVPHIRHASSSNPQKPIVLEKPSKFTPPSHPQRLNKRRPRHYGGDLTEEEKQTQKTKQYPHMMPPEGSFMHWFLTNRSIHIWITLSVLTSLAVLTFALEWRRSSPYVHMLPSWPEFLASPIAGLRQVYTVHRLETDRRTEEAAERRRKRLDDVMKRKAYRVAHGLEDVDKGLQIDDEMLGAVGAERKGASSAADAAVGPGQETGGVMGDDGSPVAGAGGAHGEVQRRPLRKWFGIW